MPITTCLLQDTCENLMIDATVERQRERAYVLPCATLKGMVKCQGLEGTTLLSCRTLEIN